MNVGIASLLISFSLCLPAAAADKQELAAKVFDAVVMPQAEPVVDRMLVALARENRMPEAVAKMYKETLLEVLRHPDYRKSYIAAYMRLFSEQELSGILELAKSPAFVAFSREAANITQLTYPTFVQLNAVMKQKLDARLGEQGLGEWK